MIVQIYAHSTTNEDRRTWELLTKHLTEVGQLTARYAAAFGSADMGYVIGMLHDLGKAKPRFQKRLVDASVQEPHSGEGAKFVAEREAGLLGIMLAHCIAGHHTGLSNGLTRGGSPATPLSERLAQAEHLKLLPGIELPPLNRKPPPPLAGRGEISSEDRVFSLAFFTRMLFSALVDADRTATARFYGEHIDLSCPPLERLELALRQTLTAFDSTRYAINRIRGTVLAAVQKKAAEPPGLFSLTVPTGGGKTLTSLSFALKHAIEHDLARIIYVAPFTAIIDQTTQVYRRAIGAPEAILEHHSAFDYDKVLDPKERERVREAAQRWDAPIVVTTAVQFFESLFANKPSPCRKLHRIARSVILLDEVQALPLSLLRPCLRAVRELADAYGASVVLCTATPPGVRAADRFLPPEALASVTELAPDPKSLAHSLRRVAVETAGALSDADLASRAGSHHQVLIIVDNRRHAQILAERVDGALHLSTFMTGRHRRHVLETARAGLAAGESVRLISTSLIEAGVDIDFPVVFRAVAGVDRMAQAAGRCNREGALPGKGRMVLFEPDPAFQPPLSLRLQAAIGKRLIERFRDPLSTAAVAAYFRELYHNRGVNQLDNARVGTRGRGILAAHTSWKDLPFADVAEAFRMIPDEAVPLIVPGGPFGAPETLLDLLQQERAAAGLARRLQPYVVNVSRQQRRRMIADGSATVIRPDDFGEQFVVLVSPAAYDELTGLGLESAQDLGFLAV